MRSGCRYDNPSGLPSLRRLAALREKLAAGSKGKRLFDGGAVPAGLELASSQVLSTGVILGTYRTGAEIKHGSFAA